MKIETSLSSYEEIMLDMKIFGKIIRENEHMNIGSRNRLARLGGFCQPALQEQINLSMMECIRSENNKNNYELDYKVIHTGRNIPTYEVYKFKIADLREKEIIEYRYNISKLRTKYEEYHFDITSLREDSHINYEEYRFDIKDLAIIEPIFGEYRYNIQSLRSTKVECMEYRYNITSLKDSQVNIEEYRFDINTLRGNASSIKEYRFNINTLKSPKLETIEYRYKLVALKPKEYQSFRYKLSDLQEEIIPEEVEEFSIEEDDSIVNELNCLQESHVEVNSEVNTNSIEEAMTITDEDIADNKTIGKQQEFYEDLNTLTDNEVYKGVGSEGYSVKQPNTEKNEISEDVSSNNSPNNIIDTKSNISAKEDNEPQDIPTDLVKFVKMYPRCNIEFALKYFSQVEINKALKIGKVSKSKNKLYL